MIGQVSRIAGDGSIEAGCPVALTVAGSLDLTSQASIDSRGVFVLETTGGKHDLHIGLPEGVIVLPPINLE